MSPEGVVKYLQALGAQEPEVKGEWVNAPCPLAPFFHKSGTDSRPSFGVRLETGGFNCWACKSGTLTTLIQLIEDKLRTREDLLPRYNLQLARAILDGMEDTIEALPEWTEFTPPKKAFTPWPDWWLEPYLPWSMATPAVEYLQEGRLAMGKGQSIPAEVADHFDLRYDTKYHRILCPYRNAYGKLAGARGRALDPNATLGHWDYTWQSVNNAALVWYNEQALAASVEDEKPLVVVEGQFDAMNVWRAYPYVVANLTSKVTPEKVAKLKQAPGILFMLDNDKAGEEGIARFLSLMGPDAQYGKVEYPPEFKDPAAIPLGILQEVLAGLNGN